MRKSFAAVAFAVALIQPAAAITFPKLTTIYIGSGVRDNASDVGTTFNCSNVSGVAAQVRFLVLSLNGQPLASETVTLAHGATRTGSTHDEATFATDFQLLTGQVGQGVVNIESTQSAVFCNAMITNTEAAATGIVLPLVRVNPHPGTVE
jgi:hypothetical protein